jgi:hypothetical protein
MEVLVSNPPHKKTKKSPILNHFFLKDLSHQFHQSPIWITDQATRTTPSYKTTSQHYPYHYPSSSIHLAASSAFYCSPETTKENEILINEPHSPSSNYNDNYSNQINDEKYLVKSNSSMMIAKLSPHYYESSFDLKCGDKSSIVYNQQLSSNQRRIQNSKIDLAINNKKKNSQS